MAPNIKFTEIVFEHPELSGGSRAKNLSQNFSEYKPRRAHQKSRAGCANCKTKRVKCDETQPRCGNCCRGDRECIYKLPKAVEPNPSPKEAQLSIPNSNDIGEQEPTVHPPTSPPKDTDLGPNAQPPVLNTRPVLILEFLLSHFINTRSYFWIGSPCCQSILQNHGVRLAKDSLFLFHAILSFSAYHLATTDSEYASTGLQYFNHALNGFEEKLKGDTSKVDPDALFACSLILSMLTFRIFGSGTPEEGQVFDLAGVKSLSKFSVLQDVPNLRSRLSASIWRPLFAECGNEDPFDPHFNISPPNLSIITDLELLCYTPDRGTFMDGPYTHALSTLRLLLSRDLGLELIGTLFCFTRNIDWKYLYLLERNEPKALLLLCRWYAILVQIPQWWITGPAKAEGRKLLSFLEKRACGRVLELLGGLREIFEAEA